MVSASRSEPHVRPHCRRQYRRRDFLIDVHKRITEFDRREQEGDGARHLLDGSSVVDRFVLDYGKKFRLDDWTRAIGHRDGGTVGRSEHRSEIDASDWFLEPQVTLRGGRDYRSLIAKRPTHKRLDLSEKHITDAHGLVHREIRTEQRKGGSRHPMLGHRRSERFAIHDFLLTDAKGSILMLQR